MLHLREIRLNEIPAELDRTFPFGVPVVQSFETIELTAPITFLVGENGSGKSTLLEALQVGVYPKLPGDGREFCMSSANASKIRSEDGRNVQAVDISTFINNLPFGKDTTNFNTPDASGSTSQAANIVEVSLSMANSCCGGFSKLCSQASAIEKLEQCV